MASTIKCPSCGESFELSQALTHQIKEQILGSEHDKHTKELAEAREETKKQVLKKAQTEYALDLQNLRESSAAEQDRNQKLAGEVASLMKELREARGREQDAKIKMEKTLAEEENKIREEARRKALEEHVLKAAEKDKVIADLQKKLTEAQHTAAQGSQQTQGEVLELEIENLLRHEFPVDNITEVKKGQRGADVIQTVVDKLGRSCGIILWESKNAAWSSTWIPKLKADARALHAEIPVLVAENPPEGVESFSYIEGVWVVKRNMLVALAYALRYNLVVVNDERSKNTGRQEKSAVLYEYMTSHEFRSRVEAIVEAFTGMQDELEREKRWFNTKWSRQEKHLRSVIDQTHGMYGDIQGVIGKALPALPQLELPQ